MSGYPISLTALSVSDGKSAPHGLTELRGTTFSDGTSAPASGTIRFLDFLNKSFGNTPTVYPARLHASYPAADDQVGSSISISGNYAIAGAQFADPYGRSSAGAAYIFERTSTTWVQREILIASDATAGDSFGISVSISGDYAVIGASGADPNGSSSGATYIFKKAAGGTSWSQQTKLTPAGAVPGDKFGESVYISGLDVIIGASGADPNGSSSGAAYVFVRSGSDWSQQAKLTPTDGEFADSFGISVSIDGNYAVIGAYREDPGGVSGAGSAYVFYRYSTSWSQQAKLVASDKGTNDQFGRSVSISGGYVIVGAAFETSLGSAAGSAYIFVRSGSSWSQQAKLGASDTVSGDTFGKSVSISSAGYAIIGASGADPDGLSGAGAAYVYVRSGSSWSQQVKLISPNPAGGGYFGTSVSIDGDRVVAGAPREYISTVRGGSAHVFKRASGTANWSNLTG